MNKHITNYSFTIGAALIAAAFATNSLAQEKPAIANNSVKIGILTDLSSIYSDLGGKGSILAAEMAINDFKSKYNPKFEIELVSADHQNKPDIAANKAKEWFDVDSVDMITDGLNSAVAIALSQVANERKKLVLNTGAGAVSLTNEYCTPYTVSWVYDNYAFANTAARAVVEEGGKTWSFLTADYAFGHSLEQEAAKVVQDMGGEVLSTLRHPQGTPDFSDYMLRLQGTGAQIIGLANAGTDTVNSIKTATEFGVTPDQKIVSLFTYIPNIHSMGLELTQDMYLSSPWYWDLNDETSAWSQRFYDQLNSMPTFNHAGVYSAVLNYLMAVDKTQTVDADTIMDTLKNSEINDMFTKNGHIREDGRLVHDMYLMQVKKPADSKYPWDYMAHVKTIPGEQAFIPIAESTCAFVQK